MRDAVKYLIGVKNFASFTDNKETNDTVRRIYNIKIVRSAEQLYQMLIARIRKYHPSTDVSMIEKAFDLAKEAHNGQCRKSADWIERKVAGKCARYAELSQNSAFFDFWDGGVVNAP